MILKDNAYMHGVRHSSVSRLLMTLELEKRVKAGIYNRIGIAEVEYRIQYWAHEALKRIVLFASDPQGWQK